MDSEKVVTNLDSSNEESPLVPKRKDGTETRFSPDPSKIKGRLQQTGRGLWSYVSGKRVREEDETTGPGDVRLIQIHGGGRGFASNRISTTKYNVLTFIPKFLFDQFRRFANLFFLIIVLLQQIPNVSPTGRYSTAVPLSFVIFVAAVKELVEDLIRFKADNEVNKRKVKVLQPANGDGIKEVLWTDVKVGDIVKVDNNSFFPSDLILLKSSDPTGKCYIETANLDGETNLKVREVHFGIGECTAETLCDLQGSIECEAPNKKLYEFTGNLIIQGKGKHPVVPDNILLRDAQLRNTDFIYGLVVYTGHESKIMKNARSVPLKRSNMDHKTNRQIVVMVFALIFLSLISAVATIVWSVSEGDKHWYLQLDVSSKLSAAKNFFFSALTFFILYNNLIPISLIVTQELARIIQGFMINLDEQLYDQGTDTAMRVRNSNLNEELGQVQFIFSDKTGTLTQNVMKFKQCSINGEKYKIDEEAGEDSSVHLLSDGIKGTDNSSHVLDFLRVLALCHSVVPEYTDGELQYRSVSPDEEALVDAAREMDVVFCSSQHRSIKIKVLDQEEEYSLLNVLEFNSTRKRMSVILELPDGRIKLLCKGADSIIYDRLVPDDPLKDTTQQHLDAYARSGLRTLCIAEAILTRDSYMAWKNQYDEASMATHNRDAKIAEVAELIEKDLTLLGATAIEDKLQENVPETIEKFHKAGLKVWVLTGDKMETAINIGYSSKQLVNGMKIIELTQQSEDEILACINSEQKELSDNSKVAIVIDGKALSYVLHSDHASELFYNLGLRCASVICCRATPSQKAEVVELVKRHQKGVITLAIGDGANDVSMIQAAHIGIGISGREGLQATLASDYALAQFRFLGRLILVHGAWNYWRMSNLISHMFYKNICLYIAEFWYIFFSGYSGQAIFQRWTIATYNLFFTGFAPFLLGVFDQDVTADTRMNSPNLYSKGRRFGYRMFWSWILLSIIHSVTLFFATYLAVPYGTSLPDGKTTDMLYVGNLIYTGTVITVNVLAPIVTGYWSIISHVFVWGSVLAWLLFLFPFSFLWPTFPIASDMFGSALALYGSPMFYALSLVLLPSLTLLPVLFYLGMEYVFWPSPISVAKDEELKNGISHLRTTCCREQRRNYSPVESMVTAEDHHDDL